MDMVGWIYQPLKIRADRFPVDLAFNRANWMAENWRYMTHDPSLCVKSASAYEQTE